MWGEVLLFLVPFGSQIFDVFLKEGGAHMHVYVWKHNIVSLYYRTTKWMLRKFGSDEVLMATHMG